MTGHKPGTRLTQLVPTALVLTSALIGGAFGLPAAVADQRDANPSTTTTTGTEDEDPETTEAGSNGGTANPDEDLEQADVSLTVWIALGALIVVTVVYAVASSQSGSADDKGPTGEET
jgi:hypothetical protein